MPQQKNTAFQRGGGIRLVIGILASAAIAAISWSAFYEDQEASLYDFRFRLRNDFFGVPTQYAGIATIDIDDLALQTYGKWPWPRDRHAVLVDVLTQYGASMIGFDMFFYEPSPHLLPPEQVAGLDQMTFSKKEVISLIKDYDAQFLSAARKAGNVYLAQTFEVAEQDEHNPEFASQNIRTRSPQQEQALGMLTRSTVPLPPEIADGFYHTLDMEIPLLPFIDTSRRIGFAMPRPDHDGVVRHYRLALVYDGRIYFALGFIMACDYLQVPLDRVRFVPGEYVELPGSRLPDGTTADIRIPINDRSEMLINYADTYHNAFRHFSYNLILDFHDTRPQNRALKLAKRIAHESPAAFQDDTTYLDRARANGGADLPPDLLLEMRNVVMDCLGIEQALLNNPDLTVEAFAASMGVPESEIPAVAGILSPFFNRIRNNLRIYQILKEAPDLSLAGVGEQMGISRLEDIKLGVGILRDLIRRGGVSTEHHPLFFLDRITSAGLQSAGTSDRILTAEDFKNTVFFYGLTATGTHDLNPTPFGAREPMLGTHANVFNTILTRNFIQRVPKWGNAIIMLAFGFLIGLLVPRFRAMPGASIVLLLLLLYTTAAFLLLAKANIWVDALGPMFTLIIGYLSITLYNYVEKEREKEYVQGAFGHYLDPKVVDELVENPNLLGQLGGDMRVMTAFFSDVASFSAMSENLTPVHLVELLNEYLTEMCEIIARHGGTIDKFEGDAIIAFYGAPIKYEDHARRAVLGAIDMQQKVAELRQKWEREGKMVELRQFWADHGMGEFFRVRMGINTGEMVVGNMGSHTRVDYTIMGDSVNLASRLEGTGKAYAVTTVISEATYRAASEIIEVRELDSIRVVGKDEAVRIYEILGRKNLVDPQKQEVAGFYAQGIAMYRERKWDEAMAYFEAGLKINPGDGPSKILIGRCNEYKKSPPPETWDAVHNLESK